MKQSHSMKGERQMEAVRTGNKLKMTQGKVWSQRYRTTYIDINNFADKNKSFFPPESKWNLYLVKVSLNWKKPILNFMSFRIIHIETEYGSDIGLLSKKNSSGDYTSGCFIFFFFFFFLYLYQLRR